MILRKFTAELEEFFEVNNVGNVNSWEYEEKENGEHTAFASSTGIG